MEDPPQLPNDTNPHPQIQQDLKGDRNQTIGQANDSTIINFAGDGQVINLTINDRIPTASLPPSHIVVQNLTQQEYRQRQVLLNKVRDAWVKGVLEKSLHARVSIELGLQERLDLVQQPFSDVAEFAAAPGQVLSEGTSTTTVFDRLGSGRTLLIVGEPGSGKTIALLKLAEDAIDRTEPDLRQQIPVVFNLSSWARKQQSIEQWLIQELLEKYQVSKALGKTWVESEALMLLLDGLDEVSAMPASKL
jgi:predicted NACHT family NTPase